MKIVILDGNALNPGDLSWEGFHKLGEVALYDRTPKDLVISRIGDAEILITNKVSISKDILDQCPNLKYIGVLATGYNIIDTKACAEKSIVVTNIPSYSTSAVAQAVFAYILEFTNGVNAHNKSVHNGDWCKSKDFCYWTHPLVEIAGKTLGIIGFGSIGKQVGNIAKALGCRVLVNKRTPLEGWDCVDLETICREADILSLHVPLNETTRGLLDREHIAMMKSDAILINVARGAVTDEKALADAITEGRLGGIGIDV